MRAFFILFLFYGFAAGVAQTPPSSSPLFSNSIVSTEIDFITADDPDAFEELRFLRQERKEMPDSRNDDLFDNATFVFRATFTNGDPIEIWCHSDFRSPTLARSYAEKLAPRLGKLPELMRNELSHVVVHNGNAGAFAEAEAMFFVLYSDNMDIRISDNDLEETVFHETIHAVFDRIHLTNPMWTDAQAADVNFITDYARSRPDKEDLAETAIFAYTMLLHPGRLDQATENWVVTHIPNRLTYITDDIFSSITSSTKETESLLAEKKINVYPNPTENEVTFELVRTSPNTKMKIYNSAGKVVRIQEAVEGVNTIDLSLFVPGVYTLMVKGYETATIVKQ
jgi:hypothetical protein